MQRKKKIAPDTKKSSRQSKDAKAVLIPNTLRFFNIKGSLYRSIQADGAWGSVNPQGNVHLVFYNERAPIPMESVNTVNPDGTLGDEIVEQRIGKSGIIRQMEVDVIMSKPAAIQLMAWIANALKVKTLNEKEPK